jgi:hypothetical protein
MENLSLTNVATPDQYLQLLNTMKYRIGAIRRSMYIQPIITKYGLLVKNDTIDLPEADHINVAVAAHAVLGGADLLDPNKGTPKQLVTHTSRIFTYGEMSEEISLNDPTGSSLTLDVGYTFQNKEINAERGRLFLKMPGTELNMPILFYVEKDAAGNCVEKNSGTRGLPIETVWQTANALMSLDWLK